MDPESALLCPYIGKNVSIYKCPADKRVGLYTGNNPADYNKQVPAARSISMNQAVGTACDGKAMNGPHTFNTPPTRPVSGPWLDGSHAHLSGRPFKTFGKTSDFVGAAAPANIWVFVDEDPYSLNDGAFGFNMAIRSGWITWPRPTITAGDLPSRMGIRKSINGGMEKRNRSCRSPGSAWTPTIKTTGAGWPNALPPVDFFPFVDRRQNYLTPTNSTPKNTTHHEKQNPEYNDRSGGAGRGLCPRGL
jgi:hypothetical protein